MADRKLLTVNRDNDLVQANLSEVEAGTAFIRVGLTNGDEHHIVMTGDVAYEIRGELLKITGRGVDYRVYGAWAWVDIATHKGGEYTL